jgi:hypothetical protein
LLIKPAPRLGSSPRAPNCLSIRILERPQRAFGCHHPAACRCRSGCRESWVSSSEGSAVSAKVARRRSQLSPDDPLSKGSTKR